MYVLTWSQQYPLIAFDVGSPFGDMRDLVNKRSFLWRKKLDELLFWLFPKQWVPLYTSVTFSNMSYTKCLSN
ncbi:unnamed protein product, partial [Timema podura]|nr:unnamed protein product [Timema podura]